MATEPADGAPAPQGWADATAAGKTARTIETVFRIERARLIGGLARFVRDVGLAEDLAQEALVAALAEWPRSGVPARPGAWLMAAAKRRAIDGFRRCRMMARKHAEIATEAALDGGVTVFDETEEDGLGDPLLRLFFAACHPMLGPASRIALTLRLIGGLTTAEIARAFLSSETAMAQRIARAKRQLRGAGLRFEVPDGAERRARLGSVLESVYLMFNEGYAATAGEDLIRPALCDEARRLGRLLVAVADDEPEVHGLSALMDIQASRQAARVAADGALVPLTEQDRTRWDRLLIRRGLAALARAEVLGGADGPYALQAALAACHARARSAGETDWSRIAGLYDRLRAAMPSPVVELNRAIAHGMAYGPQTGLALLAPLEGCAALRGYAPLPAAIGDCLFRAGRPAEARHCFERAAALSGNARERAFLLSRAAACDSS
ncbi:MAG: DUF6596 domain-containing protein [Alphaproteobacteria bacterium]